MIRLYAEFDTEAEAMLWREAMYRNYHPAGYSTHIVVSQATRKTDDDTLVTKWIAHGSRAESCD